MKPLRRRLFEAFYILLVGSFFIWLIFAVIFYFSPKPSTNNVQQPDDGPDEIEVDHGFYLLDE